MIYTEDVEAILGKRQWISRSDELDALNEAAVLRALSDNRAGKTVLLVSHRSSAAAIADVTYSVEHGRVS